MHPKCVKQCSVSAKLYTPVHMRARDPTTVLIVYIVFTSPGWRRLDATCVGRRVQAHRGHQVHYGGGRWPEHPWQGRQHGPALGVLLWRHWCRRRLPQRRLWHRSRQWTRRPLIVRIAIYTCRNTCVSTSDVRLSIHVTYVIDGTIFVLCVRQVDNHSFVILLILGTLPPDRITWILSACYSPAVPIVWPETTSELLQLTWVVYSYIEIIISLWQYKTH